MLELRHDLFLGVELAVQTLGLRQRVVDLVLVLERLLLEEGNLARGGTVLNFGILHGEGGILQLGLALQQFLVGFGVFLLLLLVAVDPEVARLLLRGKLLAHLKQFVAHLLFGQLKLLFNGLLLDFERLQLTLNIHNPLVELLNFHLTLGDSVFLEADNVLERAVALNLVGESRLQVVARLVHSVQLVHSLVVVVLVLRRLALQLLVVYLQGAQLQLQLVTLGLIKDEVATQLINLLVLLRVGLVEGDHHALVFVELRCRLVQLLSEAGRLRLENREQFLGLAQLQLGVLLLRLEPVNRGLEHVNLKARFRQVLHALLVLVALLVELLGEAAALVFDFFDVLGFYVDLAAHGCNLLGVDLEAGVDFGLRSLEH